MTLANPCQKPFVFHTPTMNRRDFICQIGGPLLIATTGDHALAASTKAHPSPGHIAFGGRRFELAWHAAPQPGYIKLEYLPAGQRLPRYEDMLLIEHLSQGMDVAQVVRHQVDFLTERKRTDPTTQHRLLKSDSGNEYLLDFLLSADDAELGQITEWNAYRYLSQPGPDGVPGVLLFAYSRRAYGGMPGIEFLRGLRDQKEQDIQALLASPVPRLHAADTGASS